MERKEPSISNDNSEKKKCPFCAELIQLEAVKCRYCGEFLDKKLEKKKFKDQTIIVEKKVKKGGFSFFKLLFWTIIIIGFITVYYQTDEQLKINLQVALK